MSRTAHSAFELSPRVLFDPTQDLILRGLWYRALESASQAVDLNDSPPLDLMNTRKRDHGRSSLIYYAEERPRIQS